MTEQDRQQLVYDRAMASLRKKQLRREAAGYAVMAAAMSLHREDSKEARLPRMVRYAQTFVILFAMALPNYLVWSLLLS